MNRFNIYSKTISYDRNSATQMCLKAEKPKNSKIDSA